MKYGTEINKLIVNWRIIHAICIALVILLAACQPTPAPTESPPPTAPEVAQTEAPPEEPAETESSEEPAPSGEMPVELVAPVWVLIAYGNANDPVVVEPYIRVTAKFSADGTLSGSGGCNSYNITYQVDGESISFGPVAVTDRDCESGMVQEAAYLGALGTATSYQIVDGERLLINYESGSGTAAQMVYAAEIGLVNTLWVLTSYGEPKDPTASIPGIEPTAVFKADGTLIGSGGCNQYSVSYTVEDDRISISLPTSTMMACENVMEQEQAYFTALELAETYHITDGYLEITYASGAAVLRLSARHMPLENVRWSLSSIDGQPLPTGVEAFSVFTPAESPAVLKEKNSVNGNAGCNGFFGPYAIEGNEFMSIGPFGITKMSCPDEIMQVEKAFLGGLETAKSYNTNLNQLTISTASGALVFHADRIALEGPVWKLNSIGSIASPQAPVAQADFTALFTREAGMPSGVIFGTTGCNEHTSAYHASLEEILVNFPGRSDNVCPPDLAEQEQVYFLALNTARDYRILGNEMQIFYDDQVLNFVATFPTAKGVSVPLTALDGTKWWLAPTDTFLVIPGSEVTALFAINPDGLTGQISGSAGCNNYSGDVIDIIGVFQVGPLNVTKSICESPPGIMEQENAYLAALDSTFSFTLDGNQLLINTGLGELVYTNQEPDVVQPLPSTETPDVVQPLPTPEAPVAVISALTEGQVD